MLVSILTYVEVVSWISHAVCLFAAIRLYKVFNILPLALKYLAHLLLLFFIFQMTAKVIKLYEFNTVFYKAILPIYFLFSYLIFLNVFKNKTNRFIVSLMFAFGLIVIAAQYVLNFSDPYLLSDSILVENIVIVSASLLYYYEMLKSISFIALQKQWKFIMVTGLFLYSLGSSALHLTQKIAFIYEVQIGHFYWLSNVLIYLLEMVVIYLAVHVYLAEKNNDEHKSLA